MRNSSCQASELTFTRTRVDEVMDRLLYELHIYDQVGDDWAKPTYPVGTKVTKEFDGVCELVRHCLFL